MSARLPPGTPSVALTADTPQGRARLLRASARFEAAADVLRPLTKVDDRVGRYAADLEHRARETADAIRDMVLLAETGGVA